MPRYGNNFYRLQRTRFTEQNEKVLCRRREGSVFISVAGNMAARVIPLIVMTRVNPYPGLGAEEKHIRILHFLRNVVSKLARSRVIVNYRKNHKMKAFVHVADWCWC